MFFLQVSNVQVRVTVDPPSVATSNQQYEFPLMGRETALHTLVGQSSSLSDVSSSLLGVKRRYYINSQKNV